MEDVLHVEKRTILVKKPKYHVPRILKPSLIGFQQWAKKGGTGSKTKVRTRKEEINGRQKNSMKDSYR